jgi:hypothetical protein
VVAVNAWKIILVLIDKISMVITRQCVTVARIVNINVRWTFRRNEIMIDLDRMTNDPTYEHYAYRKRECEPVTTVSIPVWMILVGLFGMVVAFIFIMSLTNIHH